MDDLERAGAVSPLPFGKYLLDAELAQGGMARVFEARLRGPGGFEKKLVVKQILPQLAQDPSFVELFVQEANTLVRMSHPNVVPIYELGVVDGVYFLAMERVHGATVAELLRDGPLPQALAAQLGAQICEALRYAHERFGLIHRDVTPRNVMVDGDGHVRLLDFGIAAPSAQTGRGELFGSPGYMSPEQAARRPLSPQSDLYGLGAVLYEALSGKRASERVEGQPLFAQELGISEELFLLIGKLLAQEPDERPSAADASLALRTWLARNHPEGVQRELGARAEQASKRAPQPTRAGDSVRPPSMGSGSHATPRMTKSIARSETLAQLIAEGTEALPGRMSGAGAAGEKRKEGSGKAGVLVGVGVLIVVVGVAVGSGMGAGAGVRAGAGAGVRAGAGVGGSESGSVPASGSAGVRGSVGGSAGVGESAGGSGSGSESESESESESARGSAGAAKGESGTSAVAATQISVNAMPWATVKLDGRELGSTPQRGLAVRAGNHQLLLECPPLGREAKVPLKLAAGDHRRIVVDMQTDPPTVTVH